MSHESDNQRFARVVEALGLWLPHVVVAGGWAHRLHRLHALAGPPPTQPLMTNDVDVAIGEPSPPVEGSLRDSLLAAGFGEEMSGEDQPPITRYQVGSSVQPFYLEFLTPLSGGENRRDGRRDVTARLSGVSAQKLRHLDLLMIVPWSVTIGAANGFPLTQHATVMVPNPAAYIAQKLLVLGRRKREDQGRDVLYVHDTLQVFGGHLGDVRHEWVASTVPHIHRRHASELKALIQRRFTGMSDAVYSAAAVAKSVGRNTSAESILEACQFGLERIFL